MALLNALKRERAELRASILEVQAEKYILEARYLKNQAERIREELKGDDNQDGNQKKRT